MIETFIFAIIVLGSKQNIQLDFVFLGVAQLTQKIAETTTAITLIAMGIFGIAYLVGFLLKGSPVPWRDIKEFGNGLVNDSIRAALWLSLWSAVIALLSWVVSVIALAGE